MSSSGDNQLAGKLFLAMIGVALLVVGGVFEWLMFRSYQQAKASRQWEQVEAVVIRSVIDERQVPGSPIEYRLNLMFGYSYDGEERVSDKLSPRGAKWSRSAEVVNQLADEYPTGSEHTAWVNPVQPDQAILKHDTKAAGYTLWFPALIMIGGAGMIWGAFKPEREKSARSQ